MGFQIPSKTLKSKIETLTLYSPKKLDEIIEARLSDIFEFIENHLKRLGRNGLLLAGIIITGGGSGITEIEQLAKDYFKLPPIPAVSLPPETKFAKPLGRWLMVSVWGRFEAEESLVWKLLKPRD